MKLDRQRTDAIKRHTEREIERQREAEEIDEPDEEAKEEALDSLYEALSERLDEEDIELANCRNERTIPSPALRETVAGVSEPDEGEARKRPAV